MTARAWLAGMLGTVAACAALAYGVRQYAHWSRADERQRVFAAADSLGAHSLSAARARWARERDSLAALVRQRDTVLIRSVRRVRDTTWLPRDTTPAVRLAACRVELDTLAATCDAFRVTAAAALAAADSQHVVDSASRALLLVSRVADRDTIADVRRALARAPSWGTVVKTAGVAAVVAAGACFFFCR